MGIISDLFRLGFWSFRARKYVGPLISALVAISGLGWLLYALGYDLINAFFGGRAIATFAYFILGAADLYWASRFYRGSHKRKGITLALVLMILVILSGVCWLLIAFRYNLVAHLAGAGTLATVIYLVLGLAPIAWLVVLSGPGQRIKFYW